MRILKTLGPISNPLVTIQLGRMPKSIELCRRKASVGTATASHVDLQELVLTSPLRTVVESTIDELVQLMAALDPPRSVFLQLY